MHVKTINIEQVAKKVFTSKKRIRGKIMQEGNTQRIVLNFDMLFAFQFVAFL